MKKILILAANPKTTMRLRLDQEVRDIEDGLRGSRYRDEFDLIQRWAVHPRDIRRAMLDENPQIIHFSGHGEGEEGLVFEDSQGNAHLVSGEALAGLFKLFADRIECVLLNGCYSKVQAEAIAHHINYVIGMSREISDSAAIEFAVAFYDGIGAGRDFEFAFDLACNAIQLNALAVRQRNTRKLLPSDPLEGNSGEHLIPILLKRISTSEASDSMLAEVGKKKAIEDQLDREVFEANLQAVESAGQARIEALDQKISEEEDKFRELLNHQVKEAIDWLKKHQKSLSERTKNYVLLQHPEVFERLSPEEKEDFEWQIEKYIESVYFSILSDTYDLVDEPVVEPCIDAFEVYQSAFELIKRRIPTRLPIEVREKLHARFDYLLNRLFM